MELTIFCPYWACYRDGKLTFLYGTKTRRLLNINVSWYLKGYNYTFSLEFFGSHKHLIVNETDKWTPSSHIYSYDYNLTQPDNLTFEIYLGEDVNSSWYQTEFKDLGVVEQVIWRENSTYH